MGRCIGAGQYIYTHRDDVFNLREAPPMIACSSLGGGAIHVVAVSRDSGAGGGADTAAGTTASNPGPVSSTQSQKRSVLSAGEHEERAEGACGDEATVAMMQIMRCCNFTDVVQLKKRRIVQHLISWAVEDPRSQVEDSS